MTWLEKRDALLAALKTRPLVMGILNATPDSFSDGGRFASRDAALAQANQMIENGVDILDIGGESTRPGAEPVAADDELNRVLPILETLGQGDTPLSIDTYKATVARAAVDAGAVMINDVWGGQHDPAMPETMAETGAIVVLMHNNTTKDADRDVMQDMRRFLDISLDLVTKAGVPTDRILVDPGIGFGKTPDQSLTCLNRLEDLAVWYNLPILLGLSRKGFIGHVLGTQVNERLTGTLAANMIGLTKGANILRVHDVHEHRQAVDMFTATGTVQ